MADYFISSRIGSDVSGDGSISNPFATPGPINSTVLWRRGNRYCFEVGGLFLVLPVTRANVVVQAGGAGRCVLTSYSMNGGAAVIPGVGPDGTVPQCGRLGSPTIASFPVIDGAYGTNNPVWVQSGSNVDVIGLWVQNSFSHGIYVSATNGNSLDDVNVTNCYAYANGTNVPGSTGGGTTGIMAGREVGGGNVTNVRVTSCTADSNRGHGIKFIGNAQGVIDLCVAKNNGTANPAHGLGTVGEYVQFDGTGTAQPWTNVSGTIWSINVSALGGAGAGTPTANQNVNAWLIVTAVDNASVVTAANAQLTPSATPTTPGPGEFGINGQNTLLVNFGAGFNPPTMKVRAAYNSPTVTIKRSTAQGTNDPLGAEGAGIQFDDMTTGCTAINCLSVDNAGYGFVVYEGNGNRCLQSSLIRNKKGGTFNLGGKNTRVHGNTIDSNVGPAVSSYKAPSTEAKNNNIKNHATAFQSNDNAQFPIIEDETTFYNVATQYVNTTAGSKSRVVSLNYRIPRGSSNPAVVVS